MNSYTSTFLGRTTHWLKLMLAISMAPLAMNASAVSLPDLYTAEVAYDDSRRNGRSIAYRLALREVLQRISPAPASIDVDSALGPINQYVLGWREGGAGRLWVSFDGVTMTSKLRDAGYAVWGSDRPLTLIWLAMDAPSGSRELVSAEAVRMQSETSTTPMVLSPVVDVAEQLRKALAAATTRRGVPLSFPLMDENDQAAVSESDVWGGFDDVVLAASRRYGTGSVLMAKANSANPDRIRWTWLFAGDRREFTGSIDQAAARVASLLMQEFASSPDASADVRIRIDGIDGTEGFARISQYLGAQSLIEQADVIAMRGDSAVFEVDSLTTRARLGQMLEGSMLERIDGGDRRVDDVPDFIANDETVMVGTDPFMRVDLAFRVRANGGLRR
ncbi:MAG: DUF2066 domain-containing protein [Woeseiaceae bacterium]